MAKRKVDKKRQSIHISSSIGNWKEKLLKRTGLPLWSFSKIFEPAIFFGLYHWGDYLRFIIHRGPKKVFWCGSDILNLTPFWAKYLRNARHFCENKVEQKALAKLGIKAEITPMIFDDPDKYQSCFKAAKKPKVFFNYRWGRLGEYAKDLDGKLSKATGVGITGLSDLSEESFNQQIKEYQGSIRANEFDGFSEITAKSILLGQYPITRIPYPDIDHYSTPEELIKLLKDLKSKKVPNPAEKIWRKRLEESLATILA